MKTYPTGVMQIFTPPGVIPAEIRRVPESNWYMFGSQVDANNLLQLVLPVAGVVAAQVVDGSYLYQQFTYRDPAQDIKPWCIAALLNVNGVSQFLLEFAGDLVDRNTDPAPCDQYTAGQDHHLELMPINPGMSRLIWVAD